MEEKFRAILGDLPQEESVFVLFKDEAKKRQVADAEPDLIACWEAIVELDQTLLDRSESLFQVLSSSSPPLLRPILFP